MPNRTRRDAAHAPHLARPLSRPPVPARRVRTLARRAAAAALPVVAACASGAGRTAVAPAAAGLPPVPAVRGPVDLQVRWPSANASVGPRDSTFVFGAVGTGDATLRVNGAPVPVAPNGAFLAFLPVPPADAPRYDFVVARGADTVRRTVAVRVPARRALPADGPLVVDSASAAPGGRLLLRGDEAVRVAVRAPRNARAWLVPAAATAAASMDDAPPRATTPRAATAVAPSIPMVDAPARLLAEGGGRARVVVTRGADTVALPLGRVEVVDEPRPDGGSTRRFARLGRATADTDRVIVGRPVPEGTYKWFFLPGTPVEVTGARGASTRVRLDRDLEVWIDADTTSLVPLPAGWSPPARVAGGARVASDSQWVELFVPLAERPPYLVQEHGRDLELVLYGTQLSPDILPILGTAGDSLVRQVGWEPESTERVRVRLTLSRDPYGYQVLWDATRGGLALRVRRPPVVADPRRPLAGRTIVVDAGHPPGGATGPTGLWEPVAVLPVAERVQALLAERGARVVMTRTTAADVALGARPVIARRANADAFVSIHLNALPDGVNPFTTNGTSTLFFHQHSEPLARLVQSEMVRRFRVRDLGIHYQNLAVARPTWYPAVLTEGLFLMLPEQEAAMRSPAGREAYAAAIVAGLEAYFRGLADAR